MRKSMWILLGVAITTTAYFVPDIALHQDGIESVQEAVRNDFRLRKGITLTNVGFVRKNENELQGFASFRIGLGEIVRPCIANREDGGSRYSWRCY
jgi:hypothetical protein